MGALPTLWMKQVEQDSLWTTPQGIITADSGIQSERDVCWVHNLRVFIPPHAAITKQLRLHECNVWAHKHLSVDATVGTILGHITSMPCFLLEQCGSYCLCWSLPLCHRRSQSQEESWKAAQFTQLWQCFHVCSMGTKFSPGKLLHCQQTQSIPPWYHPLVQPGWPGDCPCCLTDWLTFKREHLIQQSGKMHDGTKFMSVHAIGDSPKFWEPKSCFLLLSHRTWELRWETSAERQWKWSYSFGKTSSCNGFRQLSEQPSWLCRSTTFKASFLLCEMLLHRTLCH